MQAVFEKIIEKLEELKKSETEREDLCDEEGCGDGEEIYEDGKSQGRFEQVVRIIEIVKQEAAAYEECYKDCGECEAYNKEKHHCPKFCKVIKETVKEIEENHNGWIPCNERLPKYGEVVMCSCTNSGITISCITHKGVKPSKSVRFGQHSVIAWQPLPQPYQTNGE